MTESTATAWSNAFLRALVEGGVTDLVVCPGSRSQSLALAAAELDERGVVRLHVVLDERAAGFLALGLAMESGIPAPVITTSGSSVANLHPAVLEAFHQGTPFIAVTADRPAEVRAQGATQTADHVGILADAVTHTVNVTPFADPELARSSGAAVGAEAVAAAVRLRGPVHINPQFEEPLSSPIPAGAFENIAVSRVLPASPQSLLTVEASDGVLVIAGIGAGERAERWARELGAPLFAEVTSGAHFGPHLVTDYRHVATQPDFLDRLTTIVVVGRPTLARVADALCARPGVRVIVVTNGEGVPYRPTATAELVDAIEVTGSGEAHAKDWAIQWARRSRMAIDARTADPAADVEGSLVEDHAARADFARREAAIQRAPLTPELLVRMAWDVTWPHDRLVFGASSLVRIADSVVSGKPIRAYSNRGVAGIDGNVATAHGIAFAARSTTDAAAGVTRLLLGDLALAYDATSLGLLDGAIQIVVSNNHGGRIFEDLPVKATANSDHFERVMLTPQQIDFAALASAYGIAYRLVTTRGDLASALTEVGNPILIEVRYDA